MSQWATVQHRLTFVAQQKAGKVVVQPTNSISFLNLQHPEWPIQESVWQDKKFNSCWSPKLNSASLAVKLNCIRIGCFSVCWGGGRGVEEGEFPLPQALIFYFSNFLVTRHCCPITLLHLSLLPASFAFLYTFSSSFLSTLAFDLFVAFVVVVVVVSFLAFCCQFSVFLLISVLEQGRG